MPKPRKRRTQTMAETTGPTYAWTTLLDTYKFHPADTVDVTLAEQAGEWHMRAVIDGRTYVGKRTTLEDAFKATAQLLYKQAKEFWLRMDTRVVTAPWSSTLEGL